MSNLFDAAILNSLEMKGTDWDLLKAFLKQSRYGCLPFPALLIPE